MTVFLCIIVFVAIGLSWLYIYSYSDQQGLTEKRRKIEMIPSVISTLGVLGTFIGIAVGLIDFDTNDLPSSIPLLLDGLKTAFFTSILGMAGSIILQRYVNSCYDQLDHGVSDSNLAASLICNAVNEMKEANARQADSQTAFYNLMQALVQQLYANQQSVNTNLNNLNIIANNIAFKLSEGMKAVSNIEQSAVSMTSLLESVDGATASIVTSTGNIEDVNKEAVVVAKSGVGVSEGISSRLGELTDHTEAIVSTEGEVSQKITSLTDRLHGEVIEIEEAMGKTNELLTKKFDEFSELMKKNNTEALVEVMKAVTVEFQTQMNALINKLVQENFDQLNKSVEKLNQWQVENKAMIQSLTSQYKQMAENFEGTSVSLTKVKNDTQQLVSDGGRLDQLVNSLNEVIINDAKFKSISNDLQKTADLSKSNMESFDQSTRALNDWVKKQRNFSDSVMILINKLEELNELRNYASTFWDDTKKGMNEAVSIIQDGSQTLNRQLTNLDQQFYARLSTTLAQLDACIQSLIKKANDDKQ